MKKVARPSFLRLVQGGKSDSFLSAKSVEVKKIEARIEALHAMMRLWPLLYNELGLAGKDAPLFPQHELTCEAMLCYVMSVRGWVQLRREISELQRRSVLSGIDEISAIIRRSVDTERACAQ